MSFFRRAGAAIARIFQSAADPVAEADKVLLYSKDAAGVSQLFARSDDGTVHQITPPGSGSAGLLQTVVADLTPLLATVVSAGFVPLGSPGVPLAVAITVGAGTALLVNFSAACSNPGGFQTSFRLVVDGAPLAPIKKAGITHFLGTLGDSTDTVAIVAKITGLAAGPHTIEIWWATTGGGTTIDLASAEHHATLLVEEVNV